MWRLLNIIKGLFYRGVGKVEAANPKALLEVEKENFRKTVAQFNGSLATHAGLCERLLSQVKKLEGEERELRAKTAAHMKVGNSAVAGQYAVRLQTVTRELEENRAQAVAAETTYKDLTKSRDIGIAQAKAKLESVSAAINSMEINRATAAMAEQASGMITSIGGAGDTMDRLSQMVNEQRDQAAGRARIARDSMDMTEVNIKEAEQSALAAQALADFAAKEGFALPSSTPLVDSIAAASTPTTRTMGAG